MNPAHGDVRGWRIDTESLGADQPATVIGDGPITLPAPSLTQTVSERFCAVHGWLEVCGVMGALVWHLEHDGCGASS